MKKKKIIIGALMLLVAILIGLHIFIGYRLTSSLRKRVLPVLKERFNLDVRVNRVGVNLFTGVLRINGMRISNPPGFIEPDLISLRRLGVNVSLLALFKDRTIEVEKGIVNDAVLIVIRNKNGKVNTREIIGALEQAVNVPPSTVSPAKDRDNAAGTAAEEKKVPNTKINKARITAVVHYIDYSLSEDPFKLGVELDIRLRDVSNYGSDDVLSGMVNLRGNILADERKRAFTFKGRVAPVVDPERMSFVVTGSMQAVELDVFKVFVEKYGIKDGSVSGTVNLLCHKGVFDSDKSTIKLTFNNVLIGQKLVNIENIGTLESFTIVVPVGGTLGKPEIDIDGAVMQTLLNEELLGAVLKDVLEASRNTLGSAQEIKPDAVRAPGDRKRERGKSLDIDAMISDIFGRPEK